jgi:hypothetical protein
LPYVSLFGDRFSADEKKMNDVPLSRFLFDIKQYLDLNTLDHNKKLLCNVTENQTLETMRVRIVEAEDEIIFASDSDVISRILSRDSIV